LKDIGFFSTDNGFKAVVGGKGGGRPKPGLELADGLTEDMEAWRETIEIMADRKLMKQIKEVDADWKSGNKKAYTSWNDLNHA